MFRECPEARLTSAISAC